MKPFWERVSEVLEVDEVKAGTRFREVPDWGSLKGFGLLVLLENDYGVRMDIAKFMTMDTVGELLTEAFKAFAAEVLKVPVEKLTSKTGMNDLPEWDSVAHLRLVMEAESRFGVRYPLEVIPQIRTIRDFVERA